MAYNRGRRRSVNVDWQGLKTARRIMKNLPDEIEAEVVRMYQRKAPVVLAKARSETPVRTGALRNALSFKVYPRTKRMVVGLLTKALNRKFFYGRILEDGRRAFAQKGKYKDRHIGVIPASKYDIVGPRMRDFARRFVGGELKRIYTRALRRIVAGGDNG